MRLSRLVVSDDLGLWWIKRPARDWATMIAPGPRRRSRERLVSGLDCPFCVGTWIGFTVLAVTHLLPRHTIAGRAWRFVMTGLTLNEVAAHLGAVLGDTSGDDDLWASPGSLD
jgi:hypothetical protein